MHIVDVFKDQARCLASLITCNVIKLNDIWSAIEVLQDLYLPQDLRMPDRFKYFHTYFLSVAGVYSLKYL